MIKQKVSISCGLVFLNPFLPGGSVSEDADMMVRMWKEGRLEEVFQQTDAEQGDEEDGEILFRMVILNDVKRQKPILKLAVIKSKR